MTKVVGAPEAGEDFHATEFIVWDVFIYSKECPGLGHVEVIFNIHPGLRLVKS